MEAKEKYTFKEFAEEFFTPDPFSKSKYRGEVYFNKYRRKKDGYTYYADDVDSAKDYYNSTGILPWEFTP